MNADRVNVLRDINEVYISLRTFIETGSITTRRMEFISKGDRNQERLKGFEITISLKQTYLTMYSDKSMRNGVLSILQCTNENNKQNHQ